MHGMHDLRFLVAKAGFFHILGWRACRIRFLLCGGPPHFETEEHSIVGGTISTEELGQF
jgi:hypothetical protein